MNLEEAFQEHIERYPPNYKELKEELVVAGAKPTERVWNALHLELLAFELWGELYRANGGRNQKVTTALVEALGNAQDRWSHIYQQLINVADEKDAAQLQQQVKKSGFYAPVDLGSERPELQKLANLLLSRLSDFHQQQDDGDPPEEIFIRGLSGALAALPREFLPIYTQGSTFQSLGRRLGRKLEREQAATRRGVPNLRRILMVVLVVTLLAGAYAWASRPGPTGKELLVQAKQSYQDADYASAAALGEQAVETLKKEGAPNPEVHEARRFLSSAYYKDHQLFRAQEQLEILVKVYPDDKELRATLEQVKRVRAGGVD